MNRFSGPHFKKNIIVVGGGFAGIRSALVLASLLKKENQQKYFSVILVNAQNYHMFTPALYEIAAMPKNEASAVSMQEAITVPIEKIVAGHKIHFIKDYVSSVNRFQKTIHFADGNNLHYEYLILAPGSETFYPPIPGLKEHARPFKTFNDGIVLRNEIEDLAKNNREIKITVAGGGPAGVELIAEFINYLCYLQKSFRNKCDVHLTLLEGAESILGGFPEWIIKKSEKRLRGMGINILTHALVEKVTTAEAITKDGNKINHNVFIWTGGVQASSLLKTLSVPLTKRGSVEVNDFLQIPEDQHIFVIGDSATYIHKKTNRPLPWTVPVADSEAKYAAKNIIQKILEKPMLPYKPLARYAFILTVGKKYALADLVYFRLSGFPGWVAKQLAELMHFLSILPPVTGFRIWIKSVKLFLAND